MNDYLDRYKLLDAEKICYLREQSYKSKKDKILELNKLICNIQNFSKAKYIDLNNDQIQVGEASELSKDQHTILYKALENLKPWKKGPFNLFGTLIDAEWKSNLKWNRIFPHVVDNIKGKRIADIGCNNGYFMFRILHFEPQIIIGFEPYEKYRAQFELIRHFINNDNVYIEPIEVENIHYYKNFFDLILFMGVIYHLTDPVGVLRKLHSALRRRGKIIVESQGIDSSDPIALVPQSRYANARGIWFLPTVNCLINLLKRCDFKKINCFHVSYLSPDEQRSTMWAPILSLSDGLDSNDIKKTIEGYPAPIRIYIEAYK